MLSIRPTALKFQFVIGVFSALVGCTTTASLYPVEGPLAEAKPLPVLLAQVDGILGSTGGIRITMPDGELCEGRWSSISPMSVSYGNGAASASVSNGLTSAWGTVYGSAVSIANVPGVNRGEAMLVGTKGTVIRVEFLTGSGTASGTGVATDNHGNVFKVLF